MVGFSKSIRLLAKEKSCKNIKKASIDVQTKSETISKKRRPASQLKIAPRKISRKHNNRI